MQVIHKKQENHRNILQEVNCIPLQSFEKQKLFEILIVRNDEDESVEVIESEVIDFEIIMQQLSKGNSVFLAPKVRGSLRIGKEKRKQKNSNFITHV